LQRSYQSLPPGRTAFRAAGRRLRALKTDTPTGPNRRRIAILLSGRGSNFEAIADAVDAGRIPDARIVAVVSDVATARGLIRARERGLPAHDLDRSRFASRAEQEAAVTRVLEDARADLICLAGYMRILSSDFVARWRGRILNIHPSLLPRYRGTSPQRRALEAGDRESGCTVHFVDEGTDTGPVVLQRTVPIVPGDTEETLSARILEVEHVLYPEAITRVLAELERGLPDAQKRVQEGPA
jgi:phosphoribosylglycinamide formyltransferase 1